MLIVFLIVLVAAWAVWVNYESNKDPDYKQEAEVTTDANWPFPSSKRP